MSDLYSSGIRPQIDEYLKAESEKVRDYGDYWSASSAGYCMRLNIMRRLGVPKVPELADNATQTRIFESGKIFHEWLQRITKDAGLSIASEVELQDEKLMIRGHFDDLVLIQSKGSVDAWVSRNGSVQKETVEVRRDDAHLILYDYKTAHSASFNFKKRETEIGHYHKYQLATYMYMLRKQGLVKVGEQHPRGINGSTHQDTKDLTEARILSISKDDLRMHETQLLWTPKLEKEIYEYWSTLNGYWKAKTLPKCTCLDHDGGFMGRRSAKGKIYNDFYYQDEPCSLKWLKETEKEWKK
jgi:hypothetical protein